MQKAVCCMVAMTMVACLSGSTEASCANANKCCAGKDSKCYGFGTRMNGVGDNSSRCFCDENCVRLEDCCSDIYETCPARACEVSEWAEWTECGCGHGEKKRTRTMLHAAAFGGDKCPQLEEKQSCWVRSCKRPRNLVHLHRRREIALLLPWTFGSIRAQYMPRRHFNWNLHNHYGDTKPQKGYCARYEIVSQRRSCEYREGWSQSLSPGSQVCVECHPSAMKRNLGFRCNGEGMERMLTQWSAMRVRGCHGGWKLLEKPRECSCGRGSKDFIFV